MTGYADNEARARRETVICCGDSTILIAMGFHELLYSWVSRIQETLLLLRARSITEPSCLAISIRAKLYNKCLLFVFKSLSPIYPHNTCYLGPTNTYASVPSLILAWSHSPISSHNTCYLGPTNTYASVPSLMLAWESISHLSPLFSPPHQH
jgi:hypothetical protein